MIVILSIVFYVIVLNISEHLQSGTKFAEVSIQLRKKIGICHRLVVDFFGCLCKELILRFDLQLAGKHPTKAGTTFFPNNCLPNWKVLFMEAIAQILNQKSVSGMYP